MTHNRFTRLLADHPGYVTLAVLVVILRSRPTDLCQLSALILTASTLHFVSLCISSIRALDY